MLYFLDEIQKVDKCQIAVKDLRLDSNNSRVYSSRTIHKNIKTQCENISLNTVIKYLEYLKDAYIIDEIPQYSTKAKKRIVILW